MCKKKTSSSDEIEVSKFELSLIWPILIQPLRKNGRLVEESLSPLKSDFLENWSDRIKESGPWKDAKRAYPDGTEYPARAYSEFCYFHPFVRNFLYVTRGDIRDHNAKSGVAYSPHEAPNQNLRIMERTDVRDDSYLRIDFPSLGIEPQWTKFKLSSCWLYLFDTQVALLEIQLRFHSDSNVRLSLSRAMKVQDMIRRVYSSYWSVYTPKSKKANATILQKNKHVPEKLTLKIGDSETSTTFGNLEESVPTKQAGTIIEQLQKHEKIDDALAEKIPAFSESRESTQAQLDSVFKNREPWTNDILRTLIAPMEPTQNNDQISPGFIPLRFEHVQDDRIPLMSFIGVSHSEDGVSDVRKISAGDWLRLADLGEPGNSATGPYSPQFTEMDIKDFAYDRYWCDLDHPAEQEKYDWQSTRWLCSSHGFSAVGNAEDTGFFMDDHAGGLCHFHHHYFALFMIALFHRASLLRFKHKLAEISDEMKGKDQSDELLEYRFRFGAENINKEVMRFRTLYWFSEVSNQIQGIELFGKLRNHMNLQRLFDDVNGDVEATTALLRQWAQEKQSEAAMDLAIVAAVFTALAPILSWYSERISDMHLANQIFSALMFSGSLISVLFWKFFEIPLKWKLRFLSDGTPDPAQKQARLCFTFNKSREKTFWRYSFLACVTLWIGSMIYGLSSNPAKTDKLPLENQSMPPVRQPIEPGGSAQSVERKSE